MPAGVQAGGGYYDLLKVFGRERWGGKRGHQMSKYWTWERRGTGGTHYGRGRLSRIPRNIGWSMVERKDGRYFRKSLGVKRGTARRGGGMPDEGFLFTRDPRMWKSCLRLSAPIGVGI